MDGVYKLLQSIDERLQRLEERQPMQPDFTVKTLSAHMGISQGRITEMLGRGDFYFSQENAPYKYGNTWHIPYLTVITYKKLHAVPPPNIKGIALKTKPKRKQQGNCDGTGWDWANVQ